MSVKFAGIEHQAFSAAWLTGGLDRLFGATQSIAKVTFELWGAKAIDSPPDREGTARFEAHEGCPLIQETDLDEIPVVRMLERMAETLWDHVPLHLCEDDATVNGEYSFHAEPGLIRFEYDPVGGGNVSIVMESRFDGDRWNSTDELVLAEYDGALSDVLAGGAQEAVDAIEPMEMGLWEAPSVTAVRFEADRGYVFTVSPGEFMRCRAE